MFWQIAGGIILAKIILAAAAVYATGVFVGVALSLQGRKHVGIGVLLSVLWPITLPVVWIWIGLTAMVKRLNLRFTYPR